MKFPSTRQPSNKPSNGSKKPVKKSQKSNKPGNNQRNIIQQERANGLSQQKNKNYNQKYQENKLQDEAQNCRHDDQEDNLDAYVNIGVRKGQIREKDGFNKQYDSLLQSSTKGFKRQKNMYFLENEKYQGRKQNEEEEQDQSIEQENIDEEEIEDVDGDQLEDQSQEQENLNQEEEEDQQSENNEIHKALTLLKQKRKSTSKLINSQLEQINKEDQSHLKTVIKNKSKTTDQQFEQAVQLKTLLELYDRLVGLRYGQQRELQDIKKYPKMDEDLELPKYPPMNHELFTASRQLENQMITNLSQELTIFKTLAKKTLCKHQDQSAQETADLQTLVQADNSDNNDDNDSSPARLNVDKLYSFVKNSISSQVSQVEKELIKWSQKTSFLTPSTSTQLNSLLMQTPVGQAKKVMQNWERMASKCQQKRGRQMFKILFEPEQNIHETSDPQIYDDYDLFIELEKYYLERMENENEDGEFLQSATMKYLKNKQANQLEHENKQKDVDRKASKNRKIRYNVHTKLLNFMPSCPENVIETRDEIVRNMFNCNASSNEDAMEGNVSKYRRAQHHDETQLIDVQ